MHPATLCLAVASVFSIALYIFRSPSIKRHGVALKRPPNTLPIAGNGLLFLQARHKLFSWFVKCERQFGLETFQISVPSLPPGVVINDPKNLEYVFKNEGIFSKGDFFKRRSWDLFGNGIINADGELWRVQRKAGLNFLNNANLKVLTEVALPRYLEENVRALEKETFVDLQDVLHELTTQLMGRMAYDMEMHHSDSFSKAFDFASGATGERFQNPLWQITEVFLGGKFRASVKKVKAFGSEIVAKAITTKKEKDDSKATLSGFNQDEDVMSGSLVNSLLESIGDHQMIADAALNYLTAGRDTTAQALTWAFYLMMRNPNVIQKVRTKIAELNKQNPSSSPDQKSSFEPAKYRPTSLPYVMSVFYETLRLYPPVPFELKQTSLPTTLPDGTFLPQDSILVWATWAMNRSHLTWGSDADIFKPERWLDTNGNLITKSAFEFPVFNGGPRTCLGKKMAEIVAVQTICVLVERFEFRTEDLGERVSRNSLTLPMEGGLPCFVERRR